MKKVHTYVSILLLLICFSCNNEPYDDDIIIETPTTETPTDPTNPDPVDPNPNPTDPTTPGASMQLADYDYIKTFTSTPGNETSFTADFVINANNQFLAQNTTFTFLGTTVNGTANILRDENSRVTQVRTTVDGTIVNRTIVTYNLDKITEIRYEDLQDSSEDYTFTFIHLNNVITRTKENTNSTTKFTFDDTTNKLILRETMENGNVVKTETISYDTNGNLSSAVITGQDANTFTYSYDTTANPLLSSLNDLYLFSILNDEYDDQYEHWQAIIYSTNNVTSANTLQGNSNLTIEYDASNRIISRNGTIFSSLPSISNDVTITIDEQFQYIN